MEQPDATPEPEVAAAPGARNVASPEPRPAPAGSADQDQLSTDDEPVGGDGPWVAFLLGIALLLALCVVLMLVASSRAP